MRSGITPGSAGELLIQSGSRSGNVSPSYRTKYTMLFSVICSVLLCSSGCTDITEYEVTTHGVVTVYSSELQVVGEIRDIIDATSMLIYPGYIFIVTNQGYLLKYNSESFELVDSYQIGEPSSAGYFDLCFSPNENSAYIVGANGKIMEVDMPECIVTDEFSVCQFPGVVSVSTTNPELLYVGDASSDKVYVVNGSNNNVLASKQLNWSINCIEAHDSDTVLVGTSDYCCCMQYLGSGVVRSVPVFPGGYQDIEYFPWRKCYLAAQDDAVSAIYNDSTGTTSLSNLRYVFIGSLSGGGHIVGCDESRYGYVVSYLGDFSCRLTQVNMNFPENITSIDFDGYLIDMQVSQGGLVYVLTSEDR